jgi:hypothetical protein
MFSAVNLSAQGDGFRENIISVLNHVVAEIY